VGEVLTRFAPGANATRDSPTVFATVATVELVDESKLPAATLAKSVGEVPTRFAPGANATRGAPTVFATVATGGVGGRIEASGSHAC